MADNAVQISGKASNGVIFVVGGKDFDDFYANLVTTVNGDREVAEQIVVQAAALITPGAAAPASPPPDTRGGQTGYSRGTASGGNGSYGGNRQATQPPGQQPPLCEHGEAREWKTGTSNAGKAWKAWMCPRDRAESCEPQWVR